jgi:outer membrane protein assembly factor BamD
MHAANRDQTATRDALLHLDRLLAKYPHSPEAREAEIMWRDLRTHLAENVAEIAEFYLKREEYESAAERYRSLLNEYPGLGLDAEALYNLGVCYLEMRRVEESERIFQSIVQNYRDSEYASAAAERIEEGSKSN